MALFGAYRGPTEVGYLFIDAAYLNQRLESFGQKWFGVTADANYPAIGAGFTKTFYYDCLPSKTDSETEAEFEKRKHIKEIHFDKLRSLPGWHVSEGLAKWRKKKGSSQKEVDILITVDMLTHTYRKNMHRLAFIAGDQDFRPLLEAVVRDGMYVELWYESTSISTELKHTADATKELDFFTFYQYLDPVFQANNPIPTRSNLFEAHPSDGILLEKGISNGEQVAQLFKSSSSDLLTIVQTKTNGNAHHLHMSLKGKIDFLKKVYSAHYDACEWIKH
ncbi:NYN domain-containing protein [Collimonas humicola]|uniref:NYN domain-containing protein n=1 Tax=Collimonas humicola TaxID=2825886 RepID=UPI001B8CCCC0|nr:NYN domain-containing protein [Collimonas humicola]